MPLTGKASRRSHTIEVPARPKPVAQTGARTGTQIPGSSHVLYLGLDKADDAAIWRYAKAHEYTLVTKNTDMVDLCVVKGAPPKIVWLRVGNCPTDFILKVLELNESRIHRFAGSESQVVLSLFRLTPVE